MHLGEHCELQALAGLAFGLTQTAPMARKSFLARHAGIAGFSTSNGSVYKSSVANLHLSPRFLRESQLNNNWPGREPMGVKF